MFLNVLSVLSVFECFIVVKFLKMRKKGLSFEDKRERMLRVFHQQVNTVFADSERNLSSI